MISNVTTALFSMTLVQRLPFFPFLAQLFNTRIKAKRTISSTMMISRCYPFLMFWEGNRLDTLALGGNKGM